MTQRTSIFAGATLALLMATGQALSAPRAETSVPATEALLLAQSDTADQTEEKREEQTPEAQQKENGPAATEPAPEVKAPAEAPPAPQAEQPQNDSIEPTPIEPPADVTPPTPATQPAQPQQQDSAEPAPDEPTADQVPPTPTPAPLPPQVEQPATPPKQPTQPKQEDNAEPAPDEPAADQTPPTPAPPPPQAEQPATPPKQPAQPQQEDSAEPAPDEPTADQVPPTPTPAPPPPQAEQPTSPAGDGAEADEPARNAPILDSDKEAEEARPVDAGRQQPAQPAAPPPTSDAEAQQLEQPVKIQPLRKEEGRRIQQRDERHERREGADVLREIGDRILMQLGNHTVVESDDRNRIGRDASEVYYEELPRGRTRETVIRANGVQVVTIRDRYGDVIRRSRITPDGHEYVLVYAGNERRREEAHGWRDPGLDLPPLHLSIPARDYIFDAGPASDPRAYYDFLEQPPVEPVRRLYSVDEVRYSARIRDSVRRIDLDTITFDFGSATIAEDAIPRLAGLADAIGRLLDNNPAETFLIEGHTDAVGSDLANLALSDRRAEAIATALSDVFDIPPENLVTQGYGERYLKVKTQEPERENRRVAVRRITPLVAPVAAQQ